MLNATFATQEIIHYWFVLPVKPIDDMPHLWPITIAVDANFGFGFPSAILGASLTWHNGDFTSVHYHISCHMLCESIFSYDDISYDSYAAVVNALTARLSDCLSMLAVYQIHSPSVSVRILSWTSRLIFLKKGIILLLLTNHRKLQIACPHVLHLYNLWGIDKHIANQFHTEYWCNLFHIT